MRFKDNPQSERLLLETSAYDLIENLDRQFPARCIQPHETLEEAHRYAGKRELIDELLATKQIELQSAD